MAKRCRRSGSINPNRQRRRSRSCGTVVYKDTIVVAVAWRLPMSDVVQVEDRGPIGNREGPFKSLTEALNAEYGDSLHFVYEAEPCGFVI